MVTPVQHVVGTIVRSRNFQEPLQTTSPGTVSCVVDTPAVIVGGDHFVFVAIAQQTLVALYQQQHGCSRFVGCNNNLRQNVRISSVQTQRRNEARFLDSLSYLITDTLYQALTSVDQCIFGIQGLYNFINVVVRLFEPRSNPVTAQTTNGRFVPRSDHACSSVTYRFGVRQRLSDSQLFVTDVNCGNQVVQTFGIVVFNANRRLGQDRRTVLQFVVFLFPDWVKQQTLGTTVFVGTSTIEAPAHQFKFQTVQDNFAGTRFGINFVTGSVVQTFDFQFVTSDVNFTTELTGSEQRHVDGDHITQGVGVLTQRLQCRNSCTSPVGSFRVQRECGTTELQYQLTAITFSRTLEGCELHVTNVQFDEFTCFRFFGRFTYRNQQAAQSTTRCDFISFVVTFLNDTRMRRQLEQVQCVFSKAQVVSRVRRYTAQTNRFVRYQIFAYEVFSVFTGFHYVRNDVDRFVLENGVVGQRVVQRTTMIFNNVFAQQCVHYTARNGGHFGTYGNTNIVGVNGNGREQSLSETRLSFQSTYVQRPGQTQVFVVIFVGVVFLSDNHTLFAPVAVTSLGTRNRNVQVKTAMEFWFSVFLRYFFLQVHTVTSSTQNHCRSNFRSVGHFLTASKRVCVVLCSIVTQGTKNFRVATYRLTSNDGVPHFASTVVTNDALYQRVTSLYEFLQIRDSGIFHLFNTLMR